MVPSTDPNIWNQEIPVPESSIYYVDEAVKASMFRARLHLLDVAEY